MTVRSREQVLGMTKMGKFRGYPLFDTVGELTLSGAERTKHADLTIFLESCPLGACEDWEVGRSFLLQRVKKMTTYARFRGELQRFLLYLWLEKGKVLKECVDEDVEDYFKFLKEPLKVWTSKAAYHSFKDDGDMRVANKKWRPFVAGETFRQTTLDASWRVLSVFFRTLVTRGYLASSPLNTVTKKALQVDSVGVDDDDDDKDFVRLTDSQWEWVKKALLEAAAEDEKYELHLFVVITMKSLYLRVSELSKRVIKVGGSPYYPRMGDFRHRTVGKKRIWYLKVYGKGGKVRKIPLPEEYEYYLKRYRAWRGLPPMPERKESTPTVLTRDGKNPASISTVARLVTQALELTAKKMIEADSGDGADEVLQLAQQTHCLRHTGASMDVNAGRLLRHVSEDCGHDSVAFTESIYISSNEDQKYISGYTRKI